MSNQINVIKMKLNSAITQLCEKPQLFAKNPTRDFTRNRKIPLKDVISFLLCMEGGNLTGELLRYFGYNKQTVSASAFIQQRQKINESAFPYLFQSFVKSTDRDKLYKGYRLLAADGSDILIPTTTNEVSTYFPEKSGNASFSMLHLDAVYDLLQHIYVDASVCGRRNWNEVGTLCSMVDRSNIDNALIIAD